MNGMPQQFVALTSHAHAMDLARLKAHRRGAGKALERLCVREQGAIIANLGEQARRGEAVALYRIGIQLPAERNPPKLLRDSCFHFFEVGFWDRSSFCFLDQMIQQDLASASSAARREGFPRQLALQL